MATEEQLERYMVECATKVLDTEHGRVWTNFIIEGVARLSLDNFHQDPYIHAFTAGKQSVGRELHNIIRSRVGLDCYKKLIDQRFKQIEEAELIDRETKRD